MARVNVAHRIQSADVQLLIFESSYPAWLISSPAWYFGAARELQLTRLVPTFPDEGTMVTAIYCFEMAEQCERQAEGTEHDGVRHVLIEIAAQWRKLAEDLQMKEDGPPPRRSQRN